MLFFLQFLLLFYVSFQGIVCRFCIIDIMALPLYNKG